MNLLLRRLPALLCAPFLLGVTACSSMKLPKVSMPKMPDIKMPDIKMPDIKVPFVSDDGTAPGNDPLIPFSLRQALATGHTLDLAVYAGQRSPTKIFTGAVMVDEDGQADLGRFGKVKLAGLNASEAVIAMEAAFRRKRNESLISVHLKRIEETPLLQIAGAVVHPGVIQYYDGATPGNVLPYVGGRDTRSSGRAVYVTHDGVRAYHSNYLAADVELQQGDIVTYSDEL